MAAQRPWLLLSLFAATADAFVIPAGRWPSGIQRAGEPPCTVACSTARRRHSVLCMASVAPTPPEDDGEESSPDGNGQSDGAGSSQPDDSNQDAKESETRPFFGAFMEQAPRSKPLMDGDSLPLSFRSDNGTRESEFYLEESEKHLNPYYDVVRRLSPTELIGRFMRTASPRVQEAVRTTVMSLLGTLPKHAFETTALSTGDALANLMFQLQMTGYMFKNAEYRLSLQSSMRGAASLPPARQRSRDGTKDKKEKEGASDTNDVRTELANRAEVGDDGFVRMARPEISGKIKLTFDAEKDTKREVEVDADAYMSELRDQVEQLESKLALIHKQKAEAVEKDLLLYIKSMPESQLKGLTAGISPEVLESMRMLVGTVLGGMGSR